MPDFLRGSEFYNSLQEEDDEQFFVDSVNFAENQHVDSDVKLLNLLHTFRFWGVNRLPDKVVDYIIRRNSSATFEAVRNFGPGYLPLQGLCDMEGQKRENFAKIACWYGNTELLKYFLSNKTAFPITSWAVVAAAAFGHLSCLELAYNEFCSSNPTMFDQMMLFMQIGHCGHVCCLKFLNSKGFGFDTVGAARHGHLECLK